MFGRISLRAQPPRQGESKDVPGARTVTDTLRNPNSSPPNRPSGGPSRPGPGGPNGAGTSGGGGGWLTRILLIMLLAWIGYSAYTGFISNTSTPTIDLPYSSLIAQIDDGNIVSLTIQDRQVTGLLTQKISGQDQDGKNITSDHFQTYLPFADDARRPSSGDPRRAVLRE